MAQLANYSVTKEIQGLRDQLEFVVDFNEPIKKNCAHSGIHLSVVFQKSFEYPHIGCLFFLMQKLVYLSGVLRNLLGISCLKCFHFFSRQIEDYCWES